VPNDYVEYAAAGDFTQRMDEARVALQKESPLSRLSRTTRSKTRRGHQAAVDEEPTEFKLPTTKPRRKKILVISSDDSE